MRHASVIALHHLGRLARRPGLVLLLVAVPVTLAFIEYAAFGSGVASGKLPPMRVLFIDEDGSFASRFVPEFFSGGTLKDVIVTATAADRDAARRAFLANDAAALIVIPKGFQAALLDGRRAELVLYKNPLATIGPEIAGGVLEMLETIGNRLYAQAMAPLERIRALDKAGRTPTSDDIAEISKGLFEAGRRLTRVTALDRTSVALQRPDRPPQTLSGSHSRAEFFSMVFPGLAIFGLFFLSQSLAHGLLRDRERGVERRILTTPTSAGALAAGNAAYVIGAVLCALLLLAAVAVFVFGIELRDPLALVVIGAGFAVFASGLHLAVTTVAKSDRDAGLVSTSIMLILMLVGGTFMPAEQFPAWLRALSYRVPNGAAQQAFIDVLAHRRTLASVASLVAMAWAWAILALGAYVYLKRRSFAR